MTLSHSSSFRQHRGASERILFLDWLRGLAALIMLQGHTMHSFLRDSDRNDPIYIFSQFFGGQAAAIFLALTGVTLGLGMSRREWLSPSKRVWVALQRAGYLFGLAIAFRVSTWLLGWPKSPAADMLRVDVLNLMGVTTAILAGLALLRGMDRVRGALLAGIAIAGLSPVVAGLDVSHWPVLLRNYVMPGTEFFGIFPWGSYLAFGLAAGSAIPFVPRESWGKVMQWGALAGFGLLLGGQYFSNLPYSVYPNSDFWTNSPALVSCKLGVTLLLGAAGFVWTEYLAKPGWSWMRQLGTSSLLVYWAHVELVYGRWLWWFKGNLSIWQTVAACVGVIATMVALTSIMRRVREFRASYRSAAKARAEEEMREEVGSYR